MAHLSGDFAAKDGSVVRHDRTPIEATRDGDRWHVRVEGSGKGTLAVTGTIGTGTFTALGGRTFALTVEISGPRWTYRLLDGTRVVGEGIIFLPP